MVREKMAEAGVAAAGPEAGAGKFWGGTRQDFANRIESEMRWNDLKRRMGRGDF